MPIDKVYNQEGFNVDGFYWRSIGWYGDVNERETREVATERLQKEMRAYLIKCHPNAPLQPWQINHQSQPPEPPILPTLNIDRDVEGDEVIIKQILECNNYDTLQKIFGLLMKLPRNTQLKSHYDKRLEELKQAEITHIFERTEALTKTSNIIKGKNTKQ